MTRPASLLSAVALFGCGFLACNQPLETSQKPSAAPSPPPPVAPGAVTPAAPPPGALPASLPLKPVLAPTPSPLPARTPLTLQELPTTDGTIAIGNLDGSLRSSEAFAKVRATDPIVNGHRIQLLCAHGQYRGILADYQRAEDLLPALMKIDPKEARSYLTRAQVRAIYHEFDAALADVAQAEKLDPELAGFAKERRASILGATGKLDEALAIYHAINEKNPDISNLGSEAALLGERGELEAAEQLFIAAQRQFHDVAPFPVAWLYFQEGLMYERADRLPRARELYAAAVERLPTYAAAVAHLAGAEAASAQRDHAISLLRELLNSSDDPEYKGQLAGLLKQTGDSAAADKLIAQAKAQYQTLLSKHPRGFAAHAVRFYLGAGNDPKLAATWAEKNLAWNLTNDSLTLAIEATTAAGDATKACALAEGLGKRSFVPLRAHVIAARAFTACKKLDRAAAELNPLQPMTPPKVAEKPQEKPKEKP